MWGWAAGQQLGAGAADAFPEGSGVLGSGGWGMGEGLASRTHRKMPLSHGFFGGWWSWVGASAGFPSPL